MKNSLSVDFAVDLMVDVFKAEREYKRWPKGSSRGGQFAPKGATSDAMWGPFKTGEEIEKEKSKPSKVEAKIDKAVSKVKEKKTKPVKEKKSKKSTAKTKKEVKEKVEKIKETIKTVPPIVETPKPTLVKVEEVSKPPVQIEKPATPKEEFPVDKIYRPGDQVAKGIFLNYDGTVRYDDLASSPQEFPDAMSAANWLSDHGVFNNMGVFDRDGRNVREMNAILSPIVRMVENGVSFSGNHGYTTIQKFNLGDSVECDETGAYGRCYSNSAYASVHLATPSYLSGRQKTVDLRKHLLGRLKNQQEIIKTTNVSGSPELLGNRQVEKLDKDIENISNRKYSPDVFQAGDPLINYNPAASTLVHEMGHVWHAFNQRKVEEALGIWKYDKQRLTNMRLKTTKYSETNGNEAFAEAFRLYMAGLVQTLPQKFTDFFDNEFPRLSYGKKLLKNYKT